MAAYRFSSHGSFSKFLNKDTKKRQELVSNVKEWHPKNLFLAILFIVLLVILTTNSHAGPPQDKMLALDAVPYSDVTGQPSHSAYTSSP